MRAQVYNRHASVSIKGKKDIGKKHKKLNEELKIHNRKKKGVVCASLIRPWVNRIII